MPRGKKPEDMPRAPGGAKKGHSSGKKFNMKRDLYWVYRNLGKTDEQIKEGPNKGAFELWKEARKPEHRWEFMKMVIQRLAPEKEKEQEPTKGASETECIAALERWYKETYAVIPGRAEGAAGQPEVPVVVAQEVRPGPIGGGGSQGTLPA